MTTIVSSLALPSADLRDALSFVESRLAVRDGGLRSGVLGDVADRAERETAPVDVEAP